MSSVPVAAATAVFIGLLLAGTLGVDGMVIVWAALSLIDLPGPVVWIAVALTGLAMSALTIRLACVAWRIERTDRTAAGSAMVAGPTVGET
ncbi:MAG: hypothetical protein RLO01_12405 [Thalassobaculaceae bacterium]